MAALSHLLLSHLPRALRLQPLPMRMSPLKLSRNPSRSSSTAQRESLPSWRGRCNPTHPPGRWPFIGRLGATASTKKYVNYNSLTPSHPFLQGFLQSYLIVYTYAYHLSCLEIIPGGYTRLEAPAIGALLMSAQAVRLTLLPII